MLKTKVSAKLSSLRLPLVCSLGPGTLTRDCQGMKLGSAGAMHTLMEQHLLLQ